MPLSSWSNLQVITQIDSNFQWTTSTITYAFATSTTGLAAGGGETGSFAAFNADQISKATIGINLWDDIIAPDFSLVTTTNSNVEFATFLDSGLNDYAHAYYPVYGTVWLNRAFDGSDPNIGNDANNNLVNPTIGKHGFVTLVHEIGHALGMNHPGNYETNGVTPSNFRDSTVYSVLSYFGPSWGSIGEPTLVAWADWVGSDNLLYSPQTPMIDDVLAAQAMYGVETTTRNTDTTYGFNSTLSSVYAGLYDFNQNTQPIMCLVDGGGIDTLDVSGWNTVSRIDLNSGTFSSVNSMTSNISIAHSAIIENATTGGGNDALTGNSASNILNAGAGIDILNGGLGNDTLIGGAGGDQMDGGGGIDTASYSASTTGVTVNLTTNVNAGGDAAGDSLRNFENITGSAHADNLTGNTLANILTGGGGIDILNGGDGNDTLVGGTGADQMNGGVGIDTASYSASAAGVTVNLTTNVNSGGDAAGDYLRNFENIIGSAHADILTGNTLANILTGGDGHDTLAGGAGADKMDGGVGSDTASYSTSISAVTVNLTTNVHSGGDVTGDTLLFIENITGSAYADILTGNTLANILTGGAGADQINGGGGIDILNGGDGNDILTGGAGSDQINGGNGTLDIAYYSGSTAAVAINLASGVNTGGDAEGDTLSGVERIYGSVYNDSITGDNQNNYLYGNSGADLLNGMTGNDVFYGGVGNDKFFFSAVNGGTDTIADYVDNADKIQFASEVAAGFGELLFSGQGTTTVTVSGFDGAAQIIVKSASAFRLELGDFIFVV